MSEIYLPIDLKNKDFQFIHIDVLQGFGIACKFEKTSDCEFDILDMKLLVASIFGKIEYAVLPKSSSTRTNQEEQAFGYEMSIKIKKTAYCSDNNSKLLNNKFTKSIYQNGEIDKKCLIDLHIKNNVFFNKDGDKINFGNEFCKFYII